MALRITLTLLMTVLTVAIAGRRILWLVNLIRLRGRRAGTGTPGRAGSPTTPPRCSASAGC